MAFNWRLHTIRKDAGPLAWSERYWCYTGRDQRTFSRAVAAALAWEGADNTEPEGWNKNGQTGEWRPPMRMVDLPAVTAASEHRTVTLAEPRALLAEADRL